MLYKFFLPSLLISILLLLSGCLFIFPPVSFSLTSYEIVDDDGFPALKINFTSSSSIIMELFSPSGEILSSNILFYGKNTTYLDLGNYHEIPNGRYTLKVYDTLHNYEVYKKIFSFKSKGLILFSDEQKWWRDNERWILGYIVFKSFNKGSTPIYPSIVKLKVNKNIYYGRILPTVILPFKNGEIKCIFYQHIPTNAYANITLLDDNYNILDGTNISLKVDDILPTETFNWRYKHIQRFIHLPSADILYSYYNKLDRIYYEDYSVYVFDIYDDTYLELLSEKLSRISPSNDTEKINFIASFIQYLDYRLDPDNGSVEYPFYPLETLFTDGGDCEDKAILTVSILKILGYNVSLLRFSNHMAVGVNIAEDIPNIDRYIDNYYFLETTRENHKLGEIPLEYRDNRNATVYPLSDRPIPIHIWKNKAITIYRDTPYGDFTRAEVIVENMGSITARNIQVIAGFFQNSSPVKISTKYISHLNPGMQEKLLFNIEIPLNIKTSFKTQVVMDDKIFDEREAVNSFP